MTNNHVRSLDGSTLETNQVVTNAPAALSQPSTMQQPSTNYLLRPSSRSSPLMKSVVATIAPVQRRQSENNAPLNTEVANHVTPMDT